jgi:hypothetical protein
MRVKVGTKCYKPIYSIYTVLLCNLIWQRSTDIFQGSDHSQVISRKNLAQNGAAFLQKYGKSSNNRKF